MALQNHTGWELKNEKNKASIRWLLILVIGGYLSYLLQSGQGREIGTNHLFNWNFIGGLTVGTFFFNLVLRIYISRCLKKAIDVHPMLKYISMLVDLAIISLVLIPTGGDQSMFFVVYFVVIVSNSLRYGMRLSIIGLLAFNLFYAVILMYQYPQLIWQSNSDLPASIRNGQGFALQRELLKIGVFWLVGIYTGYIARRYEYLQGEVEKYQRLVERLMQQVRETELD